MTGGANGKLRLYTEPGLIPDGATASQMLLPVLGNFIGHSGYARWADEGRECVELVGPSEAEVAVLPFDGRYLVERKSPLHAAAVAAGREMTARAARAGLKTLVLVNSDVTEPVPLDGVVVLRTSLERGSRRPFEYALPAWHEDLLSTYFDRSLPVRQKEDQPRVGFCGLAAPEPAGFARRVTDAVHRARRGIAGRAPHRDGVFLRQTALEALRRSDAVTTDFVVRTECFHGVAEGVARDLQRRDYVDNIAGTDYTLCVRGYGNFSFRFFEVMSLGRIPLLIDTDCVLPLDFLHDYRTLCVIVPEQEIANAAEHVARHHRGLDDVAFQDLQRRIRAFWEQHLAPEGFFRQVASHWRVARGEGR